MKIFVFSLVVLVCLGLAGCGESKSSDCLPEKTDEMVTAPVITSDVDSELGYNTFTYMYSIIKDGTQHTIERTGKCYYDHKIFTELQESKAKYKAEQEALAKTRAKAKAERDAISKVKHEADVKRRALWAKKSKLRDDIQICSVNYIKQLNVKNGIVHTLGEKRDKKSVTSYNNRYAKYGDAKLLKMKSEGGLVEVYFTKRGINIVTNISDSGWDFQSKQYSQEIDCDSKMNPTSVGKIIYIRTIN